MYLDDLMTTREIAPLFGVDRVTVGRWLTQLGIPKRAAGRGLANRGVEAPSAGDLERLLHVEHLGYRGVAERYGVDFTAVAHWCKKLGVRAPSAWETRRAGQEPQWPPGPELVSRYQRGDRVEEMAAEVGVSRSLVIARLRSLGVEIRRDGWDGGKRFVCADGHSVRSTYERRVCDWLNEHGIPHAVEPVLPWDRRGRADFLANGWYVEVWGVQGSRNYAERRTRKIAAYKGHGAPLIQINHFDFSSQKRGRWRRLLAVTARPPELALPLLQIQGERPPQRVS